MIEAFDDRTEFALTDFLLVFLSSQEFQVHLTQASVDLRKYVLDFLTKKFTKIHLHSSQNLMSSDHKTEDSNEFEV